MNPRTTKLRPAGKTALVTGGTGSFGKTMVRHLLDRGYEQIRVFSRDECKQEELRVSMAEPRLKFYIGDVRDPASLETAMHGVDLVFHAAALKQVPSCEFFPMEAVQTNVIGSHNVIDASIKAGVECVVCLGTDKAVYPVNAMGMTKGLMEKVVQSFARRLDPTQTRVCSVRYGNVMCSRGSVIPLFIKQMRLGEPLTLTDPEMTRFMLPLRDSVNLVEFAFEHAEQGDVFIKKAVACSLQVLAQALLELFESDSEIVSIGVRHGEKKHEALASVAEMRRSEDMGDFMRIAMDDRDLNYASFFTNGEPRQAMFQDYSSDSTEQLSVQQTKELLLSLPEVQQELAIDGLAVS